MRGTQSRPQSSCIEYFNARLGGDLARAAELGYHAGVGFPDQWPSRALCAELAARNAGATFHWTADEEPSANFRNFIRECRWLRFIKWWAFVPEEIDGDGSVWQTSTHILKVRLRLEEVNGDASRLPEAVDVTTTIIAMASRRFILMKLLTQGLDVPLVYEPAARCDFRALVRMISNRMGHPYFVMSLPTLLHHTRRVLEQLLDENQLPADLAGRRVMIDAVDSSAETYVTTQAHRLQVYDGLMIWRFNHFIISPAVAAPTV
jgi:hypothetical protein